MSRKLKIENVYVHTGGLGGQASVHWTIGDRRFHVWLRGHDDQPEDTVHSNPITPKEDRRRDEHRSLDRTCKAQTEIWTDVWAAVTTGDMIAKCRRADREKRDLDRRKRNLEAAITLLDHEALEEWKSGKFNNDALHACAMLNRRRGLEMQLSALVAGSDRPAPIASLGQLEDAQQ